MNSRPLVAGVVPAAGRSRRMGATKALLDAEGHTFLESVLATLRGGGCDHLVVVTLDPDGPVSAAARKAGAQVVPNPKPEEGPITSLREAILHLEHTGGPWEAIVLHPVDHPRVHKETVRSLIEAFRSGGCPPAVLPTHGERSGHPVLLSRELFPELLEGPLPEGARTVVRRHERRVARLPVPDRGVLLDIDTPEAYRKVFGRSPNGPEEAEVP